MPNAIKYSTTGDTLSLKKGNIFFGVGDVGKGPSSATTYYNGVTPSAGGYTIYSYNASQTSKLSFHTAVDDAALRDYTNRVSGESFASAAQCLNWYATQTNYVCVNRDYEGIVTSGLTFCLDAGFTPSYTTSGTTWYDIGYNNYDGTLTNGPTFNSGDGGSIVFDGVDDYGKIPYSNLWNYNNNITLEAWVMVTSTSSNYLGIFGPFDNGSAYNGFNFSSSASSNKLAFLVGGSGSSAYYVQQNTQYTLNTWYHLVGVINNGTSRLYVNGVLQNDSTTMTVSPPVKAFMIGRFYEDTSDYWFPGKIAIGRFYNIFAITFFLK